MKAILESVLTCPKCGCKKEELMPTNACQWFYECKGCHEMLKPLKGDCCVFCSYGTVPCPPKQAVAVCEGDVSSVIQESKDCCAD